MSKYNVIDLFCGCGGLSKGFLDVGFNVLLGIDNDKSALETFELNHAGGKGYNLDLSKPEIFDEINSLIGGNKVDVIVAGPPCQGFSLTGPRNFDDPRNKLYLSVISAVKYYNPKAFVIENVIGMGTLYGGQVKKEIINRFTKLGYNVESRVLCAADYGVPQIRKRLIFVGLKKNIGKFVFPEPFLQPSEYITCMEAIDDLPARVESIGKEIDEYTKEPVTEYQKMMRNNCNVLYNHVASQHTQDVIDTISQVPDGGNYKDLPKGVGESRKFHVAWTRYGSNKPSNTIDTGHRNHFHYKYNRVPTVRENARLQSFPDDFIFKGTRTAQNRQVGNAVPPLLGKVLAGEILKCLKKYSDRVNTIDLFAGCGGLTEGFEKSGNYKLLGCVEWEKAPCANLVKHLEDKWGYSMARQMVKRFDIQRSDELFRGWNDDDYGEDKGLDALVGANNIDLIVGGPPCQAYSIAGRVRDKNGMKDDYRNFLFESYIKVVEHYKPKAFVFENVPGLLSARPTGEPIIKIIRQEFEKSGYTIIEDMQKAVIDFSDYGVPQKRKRIIILGLSKKIYGNDAQSILNMFYKDILPKYKSNHKNVRNAIGDLPKLYPLERAGRINGKKLSHSYSAEAARVPNHFPRWHSERDIKIFQMLADDIEKGTNKYVGTDALKKLYHKVTGKNSNVHKYYVLRWDEQSNLIPAHLYKDGLRHIHPDPMQARSITVREAARLQGFPDDYEFVGSQMEQYKMIGNAVPPLFANKLALAIHELLFEE